MRSSGALVGAALLMNDPGDAGSPEDRNTSIHKCLGTQPLPIPSEPTCVCMDSTNSHIINLAAVFHYHIVIFL